MKSIAITLAAASLFLASASAVWADVVHLRDGRKIEGVVRTEGDVVVIQRRLGELRVPKSDVRRVEETQDVADERRALEAELAHGTADERYRYAAWLRDHGYASDARTAFLSVLRVDANHPGARAALGYVRHEDRWVTAEDRNRAMGLVEHQGEWVTPEAKAELLAQEREAARAERERRRAEREAERERRLAEREAERDARRERIREYELALARARARERAADEARGSVLAGPAIVNGVYSPGAYYPNRVLGGRYWVPGLSSCYGRSWGHGRRSWGYRGTSVGTRIRGSYDGGNWGIRWNVGF